MTHADDTPAGAGIAAWRDLVAAIGDAGEEVAALAGTAAATDLAEGFGYVLQVLSDQLDRAAVRRSSRPLFLPAITPVRKLFFDNPDTSYDTAFVDPRRPYRIRGRRGGVTYLSFTVYAGNIAKGEPTRVANLNDTAMRFGTDGSFTLTLSANEQAGNWLPLAPDAHTVIARQYFLDRNVEESASYTIEALDGGGPDAPIDDDTFARLAGRTAGFVRAATRLATTRAERARAARRTRSPCRRATASTARPTPATWSAGTSWPTTRCSSSTRDPRTAATGACISQTGGASRSTIARTARC